MVDNEFYTRELQKINALREQELSVRTINELQNLYREYWAKKEAIILTYDNSPEDLERNVKRNGFIFLINQLRSTFFYLIREKNEFVSNGAIRRMSKVLDNSDVIIDDLLFINNHAVVIEQTPKNVSDKPNLHMYDDYLINIADYSFAPKNTLDNRLDEKQRIVMNAIVLKINELLDTKDWNYDTAFPKLFISRGKVCYANRDMQVFISNDLNEICDSYFNNRELNIEILVINKLNEFAIFEMQVRKGTIKIEELQTLVWQLSNTQENVKVFNKTLEFYSIYSHRHNNENGR